MQAKNIYDNFIAEYVDKAPLVVQSFITDSEEVHNYIVRFISGNTVAEANMGAHSVENNSRLDFMALKDHFKGVGVHGVNSVQADKLLNNFLFR